MLNKHASEFIYSSESAIGTKRYEYIKNPTILRFQQKTNYMKLLHNVKLQQKNAFLCKKWVPISWYEANGCI